MNLVNNPNSILLDSSKTEYDVSICIITYKAEKYIADTIKSIKMQKTTCAYEIVIGDDASTDGTPEILKDYWSEDPEHFSVIINKENLGLSTNMYNTLCKAKGKYIVILYGDDYWTDESMLQSSYNYLELHSEYIGVSSPVAFIYDGEAEAFRVEPPKQLWNKPCTLKSYLKGYDFPMAGLMFRNAVLSDSYDHFYKIIESHRDIDDASFCILLLMKGDVYILGKIMSAYRCFKKNSGANNFNSINTVARLCEKTICLYKNLNELTDNSLDLNTRYCYVVIKALNAFRKKELSWKDFKHIYNCAQKNVKGNFFIILWKSFYKKVKIKYLMRW